MTGVIELFELLEIKSELWGGKPLTERKDSVPSDSESRLQTDREPWSPEVSKPEKSDIDESAEVRSASVNTNTSASACGSVDCGSVTVKTEVDVDVDVGSEDELSNSTRTEKRRRRRRSSSFPVNLCLSNPDNNREHSNLNSPSSDRESLVST